MKACGDGPRRSPQGSGEAPSESGAFFLDGVGLDGEGRNRTGDTTIFSRVLYQLSYLAARGDGSDSLGSGPLISRAA